MSDPTPLTIDLGWLVLAFAASLVVVFLRDKAEDTHE